MKKVFRILFPLLAIGWLIFIFTNSAMDSVKSAEMSAGYSDTVVDIFENITEKPATEDQQHTIVTIIRKTAHCLEFMLLSILTFLAFSVNGHSVKDHLFFHLFLGISVGLIDEAIQLSSEGRSSSVIDVWIDFSGFLLGVLLCLFLQTLHKNKKAKKQ